MKLNQQPDDKGSQAVGELKLLFKILVTVFTFQNVSVYLFECSYVAWGRPNSNVEIMQAIFHQKTFYYIIRGNNVI